jgi:Tfp pilus assembly protein PilP
MRSAMTLGLGLLIGAAAPGLRAEMNPPPPAGGNSVADQAGQTPQQASKPPAKSAAPAPAKPATQTPAKPASQTAAKPAAQAPAKPVPTAAAKPAQTAKPASPTAAKPAATAPAKQAVKASQKPARRKGAAKSAAKAVEKLAGPESEPKAAAESELRAARRDPFESLVSHGTGKAAPNLPPGKAGLQVSTLRLDGIVRAPNGMIAVVSNPQSRTYFLREGDHLYDGSVEKITMDGVSFHEEGKDAFGKPVERQVNKRIYSTSSGEQQ